MKKRDREQALAELKAIRRYLETLVALTIADASTSALIETHEHQWTELPNGVTICSTCEKIK